MRLDLVRGRFLRRYQRFFADVRLEGGGVVTAHCPNTGTMATLLNPGVEAWLRHHDNPRRKLPWTLTYLGLPGGGRALVDTSLPNRIVEEGIARERLPELSGYSTLRREVPYGRRSRVDLLVDGPTDPRFPPGPCYIEVKNSTMASSRAAKRSDFPDARTDRGRKHLEEMAELARRGVRAVQVFLVGRTDCREAGIAAEIDPAYEQAIHSARAAGVEILAYRARLTKSSATLGPRCPFTP